MPLIERICGHRFSYLHHGAGSLFISFIIGSSENQILTVDLRSAPDRAVAITDSNSAGITLSGLYSDIY